MSENNHLVPRFTPVGEGALLVELADRITKESNLKVRSLDAYLQHTALEGVQEWIPAYSSLLVLYDPRCIQLAAVQHWLEGGLIAVSQGMDHQPRRIEMHVRYGGANGPDLAFVAEFHHLSPAEVIERHTLPLYHVGMMGFMPGFAYLLGLDPALATPRQQTPRTHVPAGSVGIAGEQTGVYPLASPGGWQLIGRTEQVLFDPQQAPFFTLAPGDEVHFIPLRD